ncbi:MAG TPA: hypothetical protein ENH94_08505 [Phycisphaerales bacterium]|nr:hypothetical protein [Phycisphaerales bacterium]
MTISLIVIIVISGCGTQITSRQMRTAEDATDWPIVWSSERGNPYARDGKIYIDTGYLEKKGVSHQLMYVVKHESAHLDGYWWECNRRCLMNPVIPWFGTRKICSKCRARLRPTTSDWLGLD